MDAILDFLGAICVAAFYIYGAISLLKLCDAIFSIGNAKSADVTNYYSEEKHLHLHVHQPSSYSRLIDITPAKIVTINKHLT